MSDLQILIAEYNEAEQLQGARLRAIFDLIRAQPGYHRVAFSDGAVWSQSLLQHEDPNVVSQSLADMTQTITEAV